jgi:AcrR family transcriptional regulator
MTRPFWSRRSVPSHVTNLAPDDPQSPAALDDEVRQPRGRPRSLVSEHAILAATLDLLAEGHGPATISITAIARRAGAGKDTIYRRWPCKEDLLLDALASQQRPIDIPPDAPVREGLIAPLADLIERLQGERNRRILRSLHGAGDEFPKLNQRYHEQVIEQRRERVRELVRAGIARGELTSQGDPTQAAMMPFAAVVMNALEDTPILGDPRRTAARMVDAVLHGIAASAHR